MSAYPPGVSGREPQIAGPLREFEVEVECAASVEAVLAPLVLLRSLLGETEVVVRGALEELIASAEQSSEVGECGWSGRADAAQWDRYSYTWTCPRCGADHEGELDEPEVDGERDDDDR